MRTDSQPRIVAASARAGDGARWWATIEDQIETPIAKLIGGFAEIGQHQIPYGWLPVRAHSAYGGEFTVWSDLGGETISTLLGRPFAGEATIRAVLLTARESVARNRSAQRPSSSSLPAVLSRFIERFDDYDRILLSARAWALRPRSIEETSRQLGVAKVNIHRNERRSYLRFQDLLNEPWHEPVAQAAMQVRTCLGALTCEDTAAEALARFGLVLGSDAGQIVMHLAGPYRCTGRWLEIAGTLKAAEGALSRALNLDCAPTLAQLTNQFATVGITASVAVAFIEQQPGLRRVGDQWVRWSEGVGGRAEAALHLAGKPRALEQIAAAAGLSDAGQQRVYLRSVLNADPRFTRTTRRTWGLRRWGLREYAGIYGEIGARIDVAGGAISTAEVVADMIAAAPDITEASIRKFMSTPGYIIEKGIIRRRTASDPWPKPPPPASARGVFHNGRQLRVAMLVNGDLLRGSGQPLHAAAAAELGIVPGDRTVFTGLTMPVSVHWRLSSNRGPSLGSLRQIAADVGADDGDTLVLAFDVTKRTVKATRIAADAAPAQRLAGLLGRSVTNPLTGLARALQCKPGEVVDRLNVRGDGELVELLR